MGISIHHMYLHVLLKYNARVAARPGVCEENEFTLLDLTLVVVNTRPITCTDWGESCVTTEANSVLIEN